MRLRGVASICALGWLSLLGSPGSAAAERASKGKNESKGGLSSEDLALMLVSSNPDELRMAIESAAQAPKELTPLLVDRVRTGLPPELLSAALDALVASGDGAGASALLADLAQHRRAEVRARALLGLATLRTSNAESCLVKGLSDMTPDVRSSAAQGLALLGARQSLPELFRAFDRDVDGAAAAIGELAEPTTISRITDYIGRSPFTRLSPLLDALLFRRNLPDDAKLTLVDAIVRLGTRDARAYLEGVLPKLPGDISGKVRKTIIDAVARMPK